MCIFLCIHIYRRIRDMNLWQRDGLLFVMLLIVMNLEEFFRVFYWQKLWVVSTGKDVTACQENRDEKFSTSTEVMVVNFLCDALNLSPCVLTSLLCLLLSSSVTSPAHSFSFRSYPRCVLTCTLCTTPPAPIFYWSSPQT